VGRCVKHDATGHGESAQRNEKDDTEKDPKESDLATGFRDAAREKKSGRDTNRDNESDNGESERHVSARG
jgi:hypothetical protein